MITVDRFIENFKKGFEKNDLEDVFLHGNCFHFSIILEKMYDGIIVYDPHMQHFCSLINDRFYDITGEIKEPLDWIYWRDMEEDERFNLERDCVYKI